MTFHFQPGDFLVFQIESAFALLRVLARDDGTAMVWHIAAYEDLFPDVEAAEAATANAPNLVIARSHMALTDRAFESTQVARISHAKLTEGELSSFRTWRDDPDHEVSDRSVRLMLGLR